MRRSLGFRSLVDGAPGDVGIEFLTANNQRREFSELEIATVAV